MKPNLHTATYTSSRPKDFFHKRRLIFLCRLAEATFKVPGIYCDIGCSEGYVTNAIAEKIGASEVIGLDHNKNHLKSAQNTYRHKFAWIDLNSESPIGPYPSVSCFETLEHVGNLTNAVRTILRARAGEGACIISVPNEIGLVGLLKGLLKLYFFGYELDELSPKPSRITYLRAVMSRKSRISKYRRKSTEGWGTHFGFDYRDIEDILEESGEKFQKISSGTTIFFVILPSD